MIKSKVIDIIKYFSNDEMKQFSDFVASPYFNNRTILVKFLDIYRKHHPEFNDEKFTKENVFTSLYPGKKYNDELFRNLNSDLMRLSEEYLTLNNFYRNPVNPKIHLLKELNIRKIFFPFEKRFEETEKISGVSELRDKNFYLNRYNLLSLMEVYKGLIHKYSVDEIRDAETNFIVYVILNFLELKRYILYIEDFWEVKGDTIFKTEILYELLKKIPPKISGLPQIKILYYALKLKETNKKEFYFKLKELINKNEHLFDREVLFNLYDDMVAYVRNTQSPSDISTAKELFDLRLKIVEEKLFMDTNYIPYMFFINLVKSALRLKKFDWVKKFLKEHEESMDPTYKESTLNFCLAQLNFSKNNFQESLRNLTNVKYDTTYFNLELKLLTSKIYFESREFNLLVSYLDSYKKYIFKNKSIDENAAAAYLMFINILNKLIKIYELKKYHKLEKIEKEINKIDYFYKSWLLEKVNQLKKIYYES